MKKTYILTAFLAVMASVSCVKESRTESVDSFRIGISVEGAVTKATSPSLSSLNEDAVLSADILIWADPEEPAVHLVRGAALTGGGSAATGWIPASVVTAVSSAGGGKALVMANLPAGVSITGNETLEEALALRISSPLSGTGAQASLPMFGVTSLAVEGRILTGSVSLKRSVAKVDVKVVSVTSPDGVWLPDPSGIRATLKNALSEGTLGAAEDPSPSGWFDDVRYPLTDGGDGWEHDIPFYTYPSDWRTDADHGMQILLSIPWSDDGGSTWKICYYQVPVGGSAMKVLANEHHEVRLSVSILGSFEESVPTRMDPSFIIQGWGSVAEDTDIKNVRYLVVESNELELHNTEETSIRYYSSHPAVISSQSLKKENLKTSTTETIPASDYTLALQDGVLYFKHTLDNSGTSGADYTPYVLTAVIRHEDEADYYQSVTITQYPAITVVAWPNSGQGVSRSYGYAYVNNGSGTSYGGNPSASGTTSNYNMYVISVTAFGAGSSYTIGDPRSPEVNNLPTSGRGGTLDYTWSSQTYDIDGNRRRLSWYHPTESGERTVNMLAPSFRVASSYGACTKISYENAQRRCASYQEDGFPAGRWRVPTAAEVMYIISLSEQETIPALFTTTYGGNGYWCANGSITGNRNNKGEFTDGDFAGTHSVRCVYDEWYWGSDQLATRTAFRWGDKAVF